MRAWIVVLVVGWVPAVAGGTARAGEVRDRPVSLEQYERASFKARKTYRKKSPVASRLRKIRYIEELLAQPNPEKADLTFRLAETQRELAMLRYFKARDAYDAALECYEAKRCSERPVEPHPKLGPTLASYRRVLTLDPSYRRSGEVRYHLGRTLLRVAARTNSASTRTEGVKALQDMVQLHPRHALVPLAHLALGEHYFATDDLRSAKAAYDTILNNHGASQVAYYARYKLAWVLYNMQHLDEAVATFKAVVGTATRTSKGISLREQALHDLVLVWADVDGGWQQARAYLTTHIGAAATYARLRQMAALVAAKDRDDEAVALYRWLNAQRPLAADVVDHFEAILEIRWRAGDLTTRQRVVDEVARHVAPRGRWWTAQGARSGADVRARARRLLGRYLATLANAYHRTADKAAEEQRASQAAGHYRSAAQLYRRLLAQDPKPADAVRTRFFLAEILFHQTAEYAEAATLYEAVMRAGGDGEYGAHAALGALHALDKLLCKRGVRRSCDGTALGTGAPPKKATDLHPLEQRYVAVADAVVKATGTSSSASKTVPHALFVAAQVYWSHGHLEPAITRLKALANDYPSYRFAPTAARSVAAAYGKLQRWNEAIRWVRRLRAEKRPGLKRVELDDMLVAAGTEHARALVRQRRFDAAIAVQRRLVTEFGRARPEVAATATFNVGAIHQQARRVAKAVAAYEDVLKRWPRQPIAIEASFAIGLLYEAQTRFEDAARAFRTAGVVGARSKATRGRAADALRNAGLLYEALDAHGPAAEAFERYVATFPDQHDVDAVAFRAAAVRGRQATPKARARAAKAYLALAKRRKADAALGLRATSAAGVLLGNKRLLNRSLKQWDRLVATGATPDAATRSHAARAAFALAETEYRAFEALSIEAMDRRNRYSSRVLKRSVVRKADALQQSHRAYDRVLTLKDPNLNAAAAFRIGLLYHDFAESLFKAPTPPGLTGNQLDTYRSVLEDFAAALQEKALVAFTAALDQALRMGVYNKWSRLSAKYAAKVDPDTFPIAESRLKPDKNRDSLESTSFIRVIRRGGETVDFGR